MKKIGSSRMYNLVEIKKYNVLMSDMNVFWKYSAVNNRKKCK